jgi:sRNA-binding protein
MRLEEEPGALASAGPPECASTPPAHSLNNQNRTTDQTISALAELFPSAFVMDKWKPHKPLKIGIHQDLIDGGVLLPDEGRAVFRRYCSPLMYQRALAAGGPRYGLNGEPAGEVTAERMAGGKSVVTAIEAKRAAKAKANTAERTAARKGRQDASPDQGAQEIAAGGFGPIPEAWKPWSGGTEAAARARREAAHG